MNPEKQEEQRIGLCIDKKSGRESFEGVYCTDYLTAITNTMFDHAKQLSDKKFQQHFFQNFTEYLSPEIKGWVLWDDFQKVSRKFEELKLENIYNNLNLTFDGTSQLSEKERVNDYLYDLRGQIAVEVAKTNPRINLYLYYDPEYANARDEMGSAIGAGDLMTLVANWSNDVASVERQVANGGEESYPSHTLRYVYHNKEELAGRVYLYGEGHDNSVVMYDLKGKLTDVMPWERDEGLAVTWKEECRITNLTLDPAYAANHLQQSSTVRQNSGEEKDIKEFADKNPVFEKELREGEGKNIPFISYSYSFGLNSLAEQEHYKRIARIAPSSTVRQSDNQRMYMIYGEEKDIKKFLDKHPMFEKELREGEKKNIPFTPYAYASEFKSKNKKLILWNEINSIINSRREFQPENLTIRKNIDACFEKIMLEVAKERSDITIVMCNDYSIDKDVRIVNGSRIDSRAAALRYIYHTPELREKVVFYNGAQNRMAPWEANPELWKACVKDFGMDLRPNEQLTQPKSTAKQDNSTRTETLVEINPLENREESKQKTDQTIQPKNTHQDKPSQLKDLASRHNHQSLSDIMQAADIQHKENNQSNNWKQDSPTKQNVSTNTQKEISLIKAESWADSNESKRVGQLIKTWETPSQTTSATTLDSRKQGLGQLLEDVTTRKSYPSGDKKQVIPNKALSLSKTQPHLEF
ncbi:hypothetical protein CUM88_09900 [Enterococcus faecium]|uniref:hypothetical protein n=1 Tax=Enterococcus faecium TaxID=1352 RepID=UPI000CF23C45|nr:hypothetical protein [Enterococcus faecium]EGP5423287.1 hypothetical protein [Enterococcus faecium]EME8205033.1 hypothetical protein [Enterococcus faecium]NTL70685.1 hypothetical protein [Enterococcus faecium]PQC04652.1 hypothetical protein CUM88_09900 [Enterococcus faecium]PQD53507.1 hypothetical protein CUM79_05260 [Enterococcus faecium]